MKFTDIRISLNESKSVTAKEVVREVECVIKDYEDGNGEKYVDKVETYVEG